MEHHAEHKDISDKYCPRFGQIAVEKGFITPQQLVTALRIQDDDSRAGRPHRYLGVILFDSDWMTGEQIDEVLTTLFRRLRAEQPVADPARGAAQGA